VPDIGGDWGHPVLLGPTVVEELRSSLADSGAHHVVERIPERIVRVPSSDARLAAELNTPEQATALRVHPPR
jgi:CTP:molybdopterin cytidylyltransferase MocA